MGVREVSLTTTEGLSLLSGYLPPREERPVIVYFHGNGGNIGGRGYRLERFAREGYGVLMAEYRGYGGNPGAPTETGLFDDARAGLDFLQHQGIARASSKSPVSVGRSEEHTSELQSHLNLVFRLLL